MGRRPSSKWGEVPTLDADDSPDDPLEHLQLSTLAPKVEEPDGPCIHDHVRKCVATRPTHRTPSSCFVPPASGRR